MRVWNGGADSFRSKCHVWEDEKRRKMRKIIQEELQCAVNIIPLWSFLKRLQKIFNIVFVFLFLFFLVNELMFL